MARIIPTLAPHSLSRFVVALHVLGAMLLGISAADARSRPTSAYS